MHKMQSGGWPYPYIRCMDTHIHTYIHTNTYIHIHTLIYTYIQHIYKHMYTYIPVQLTPAMIPVEHAENSLLISHCCMFSSGPLQDTSMDCEDETAMLSGIPPVEA